MSNKPKRDPVSVLTWFKRKCAAAAPAPLAFMAREELAAFRRLREIIGPSKLLPYLDQKQLTPQGERPVYIDEALLARHYPGLDLLTGSLPGIDAFIYVYDGITGQEVQGTKTRGDLRHLLDQVGFRDMLLGLARACRIHQFCGDNVHGKRVVTEPLTRKPVSEARKEALAMPRQAKEVFRQIADRLAAELATAPDDAPQVIRDAKDFAHAMHEALEPLARIGKQLRSATSV
jgi:hypothetical protein